MTRPLRALLLAHGIVTIAAAVVLAVVPAAIPGTVGIALQPDAFLLAYLLAAAELAIGILSLGATRLTDSAALTLIIAVFVVFHLATAALEALHLALTGFDAVIVINIVVRLAVSAAFLVLGRTRRVAASG